MSQDALTVQVTLHIFNPRETFTPIPVPAELVEVSPRSIRLHTTHLSEEECTMLMEERTLAKIEVAAPFLQQVLTLKADIFWATHMPRGADEPACADLGFNLRPLEPLRERERELMRVIEYHRAGARGG